MNLIHYDGFEPYSAVADMSANGYSVVSGQILGTPDTRYLYGQGLSLTGTIVVWPFPSNMSELGFGIAFWVAASGTEHEVCAFRDGSTIQFVVTYDGNVNRFRVRRGGLGGTLLGTSTNTFTQAAWHTVEIHAEISDSIPAGGCRIVINRNEEINLAPGTNIRSTANNYATSFVLGGAGTIHNRRYDDLYLTDGELSEEGPRIVIRPAYAEGESSEWARSDDDEPAAELVGSPTYQTDTYLYASEPGKVVTFALETFSFVPDQILGVKTVILASKDDAGDREIRPLAHIDGDNYLGVSTPLSDTPAYVSVLFNENPATSAPWDLAGLNDYQPGAEITE